MYTSPSPAGAARCWGEAEELGGVQEEVLEEEEGWWRGDCFGDAPEGAGDAS